jgi:glycosyltransferase involved in cell wall biosynthesis
MVVYAQAIETKDGRVMNIGWDVVDVPPIKDGTFEFITRWVRAVGLHPAGHRHICYANAAFYHAVASTVPDAVEWRIAGDWARAYQLRREAYFWRHGRAIAREVDVLLSVYRPPLVWKGKSISIVLDCTKELFPTVRSLKAYTMAKLRDFGARRSGRWLAISEWTRQDAIRLRGYAPERIRSAGIPAPDIAELSTMLNPPESLQHIAGQRYAFYCSAISMRKNHPRLIRAWRRAFPNRDVLLVLAGRELPGIHPEIREEIAAAERDGVVRYLGLVSDAEREYLYAGADFVVYPSLYEGFGMPILEALQHSKPVLTSSGSATEEVGGDAVLLCNPADEEDMVSQLRRIASDEALRSRLREAIPERLKRYSLEHVASELHAGIDYLAGLA